MKTTLFWIWLAEALGAGNRGFKSLIELYKNPYDIFNAEEYEFASLSDLPEKTLERLNNKNLSVADRILESCEKLNVDVIPYTDERYPPQLREIQRPPILLYSKGEPIDMEGTFTVGMVGTRNMSAYGLQSAYKIAYGLARANAVVVSGMAAGIDGVSAAAALKAEGKTVAILGCGIDQIYPKHHGPLMDAIAKNGWLLSEYPPGTKPNHYHFPMRNRLISGLSATTVVVEAGLGSGSLITAKDAIAQGKVVFAVPANIGGRSAEGSNGLLRDGAKVATSAKDILQPYEYVYADTLHTERLIKLRDEELAADCEYLDRLGVIELVKRSPERSGGEAAEPKDVARKPRRQTQSAKKQESRAEGEAGPKPAHDRQAERERQSKQTPEEVLNELTQTQITVLEAMPDDRAIPLDALNRLELPYGEILAALTMLEVMGLIQKLPGALYTKI